MENVEKYINLINVDYILNYLSYICCFCVLFNFIISFINDLKSNNNSTKTNEDNEPESLKMIIAKLISTCIILGLFFYLIFTISTLLVIMYIPSMVFIIYIIYIKPMKLKKDTNFHFNYYSYGSILFTTTYFITKMNHADFLMEISDDRALQAASIIIVLIKIYCLIYCLILNIYFFIKSLNNFKIETFKEKYASIFYKYYNKFSLDNLTLDLKMTNKELNKKVTENRLLIFFCFFTDTTMGFLKLILSLLFQVTLPIYVVLESFFTLLIKIAKTNENHVNYKITKIVLTSTIIIVDIILQIEELFNSEIISIYEFIASVIIIPIVLDGLLTLKEKIKNVN